MKTFALHFMGRFGNQMFQYAFARGYAERHGLKLETDSWIGQSIFEIDDPPISKELPRMQESEVNLGMVDVSYLFYAQNQVCADFYSKSKVKSWFNFKDKWKSRMPPDIYQPVAHYRSGDYMKSGYPVVSVVSIQKAALRFLYNPENIIFCKEENCLSQDLPLGLQFLDDFMTMIRASVLFRSNSTFSWWAGSLGDGVVYSPRIDGLEGGKEYDNVEFELGNHCRMADLAFISDIHLKP